jgi:hypothetical protein
MPSRSAESRSAASRSTWSSSQPNSISFTAQCEPAPDSLQICPSAPRVTGVIVHGPGPSPYSSAT